MLPQILKEMLMHRTRQQTLPPPPDLFAPCPIRPTWDHLPRAVRQSVLALLAELLRNRHLQQARPELRKEAVDE